MTTDIREQTQALYEKLTGLIVNVKDIPDQVKIPYEHLGEFQCHLESKESFISQETYTAIDKDLEILQTYLIQANGHRKSRSVVMIYQLRDLLPLQRKVTCPYTQIPPVSCEFKFISQRFIL